MIPLSKDTDRLVCPECGETFEEAEDNHRLHWRNKHRDLHERPMPYKQFVERSDTAE